MVRTGAKIHRLSTATWPVLTVTVTTALLHDVANLLVRLAILLLTLPLGLIAVSLVGFFVSALAVRITVVAAAALSSLIWSQGALRLK